MLERLKSLREMAGVSQKVLAENIGVSQQSINKYENHSIEPDIATMIRIANFFDTSVDYLIGNADIKHRIEVVQSYELNADESAVIEGYRLLNSKEKESIHFVIRNYNNKR